MFGVPFQVLGGLVWFYRLKILGFCQRWSKFQQTLGSERTKFARFSTENGDFHHRCSAKTAGKITAETLEISPPGPARQLVCESLLVTTAARLHPETRSWWKWGLLGCYEPQQNESRMRSFCFHVFPLFPLSLICKQLIWHACTNVIFIDVCLVLPP